MHIRNLLSLQVPPNTRNSGKKKIGKQAFTIGIFQTLTAAGDIHPIPEHVKNRRKIKLENAKKKSL